MSKSNVLLVSCFHRFAATDNLLAKYERTGMKRPSSMEDAGDAALAIIKGGASRNREIYYPYFPIRPMVLLKDWLEPFMDRILIAFVPLGNET